MRATNGRAIAILMISVALAVSATPARGITVVVDNADAEFAVLGGTWDVNTSLPAFGTDFRYHAAATTAELVRFTPDLPLAGPYQVLLTWPDVPTEDTLAFSTTSPFTVSSLSGLITTDINQQIAPVPDLILSGVPFELLGPFDFLAGTAGFVELSADADGIVMADAVAFVLVPEPATFSLLALGVIALMVARTRTPPPADRA